MEIETASEGGDVDDKAIKWDIVPFKGDPNKDLVEEAMKEFGVRKAKRKRKVKKIKK